MKKLISMLLAVALLALPLCSFAEEEVPAEVDPSTAAMMQAMNNPVVAALVTNLMSGKALYGNTTFALEGTEALVQMEGVGPTIGMVTDLLNALSYTEVIQLAPLAGYMGLALNGTDVFYLQAEGGENGLFAASNLLGDTVVAATPEELTQLAQNSGLNLEETQDQMQKLTEALQNLKFENTEAFMGEVQPTVEQAEVTEQPADASPAAVKMLITLPEGFWAGLAEALKADILANAETLATLNVTVDEENLSSFAENMAGTQLEPIELYLSAESQPVAAKLVMGAEDDKVTLTLGIQYAENGQVVTCAADAGEKGSMRMVMDSTALIGDEISVASHVQISLVTPEQSMDTTADLNCLLGVDEEGDVVGQADIAYSTSQLPGVVLRMTSQVCTGDPLASIASEDAVHPAAMGQEELQEWVNTTVAPNLMVMLGNILQNAPESVATFITQMITPSTPAMDETAPEAVEPEAVEPEAVEAAPEVTE